MFSSNIRPYNELLQFVENTKPNLSFFGTTYLTVQGSEKTQSIDSITIRIFDLVKKNYEFSEKDREIGRKIMARIKDIYSESDLQVEKSNILTRIFVTIRHFFELCSTDHYRGRYRIDVCFDDDIFDFYTESQFLKKFWIYPKFAEALGWRLECKFEENALKRWRICKNEPIYDSDFTWKKA